jgi:hypothetical protein
MALDGPPAEAAPEAGRHFTAGVVGSIPLSPTKSLMVI